MDDKKKISIIGGSAVLLVAVVAAVAVVSLNHKPNNGNADGSVPTSVKAIKNFCQPTEYKETCEDTLTNIAGEKTDIKSLVLGSIRPIVEHLKDAVKHSSVLLEAEKDPQAAVVLKACSVYFDYAMQDLEEGISKIEGYELKDMWQAAYDIQDYLSAATQYQLDCLDDFKNATSDAAIGMKNALSTSAMLTHNGLIIVNKFVSAAESDNFHSSLGGGNNTNVERKPTDVEGIPSWVSSKQRMVLQTTNPWDLKPFAVVAKDGSGNFTSVIKALNSIPIKSKNYTVIYVKEGVYDELVVIKKNMHNVVMVGDGKTKSKITGKLSVGFDNVTTTNSATFTVMGRGFIAKDMGFENSIGPAGGQAVAARIAANHSIFYQCQFDGFQDTLYVHSLTQYYRDCSISGTVDFIFGGARAYFQNCNATIRRTDSNRQMAFVTAQSRNNSDQPSAIVLDSCHITAEPEVLPYIKTCPIYLGRPWKPYARVLIVNSEIDDIIKPEGYIPMSPDPLTPEKCFYAEVGNHGPGADRANRVKWPGIKNLTYADLDVFSVPVLLKADEDDWLARSGVPVKRTFQ